MWRDITTADLYEKGIHYSGNTDGITLLLIIPATLLILCLLKRIDYNG